MNLGILINKDTRVLIQGITGHEGSFQAQQMLEFGTNIVAGVTPGKGGEMIHGIPVFNYVKEAADSVKPNLRLASSALHLLIFDVS